jgi:hypothetical protein
MDATWNGSAYGVVWESDDDFTAASSAFFARFDSNGDIVGSEVQMTTDVYSESPVVTWTGAEFGIVWIGPLDSFHFARFDGSGNEVGSRTVVVSASGSRWGQDLVWAGNQYGLVWMDFRHGNGEIYFARLTPDGQRIGPELRVTDEPASSANPRLVWTGAEFGVVWSDSRPGTTEVFFARISASGSKLGDDVQLTQDDGTSSSPRTTAWNGSSHAVIWTEGSTAHLGWFDTSGILSRPIEVSSGLREVDLAWTGSSYGVFGTGSDDHNYFTPVACHCEDGDGDGDGFASCFDCDDFDAQVFPGAPQICDGLNNDCNHPEWPSLEGTPETVDDDGDSFTICQGDCDDTNLQVYPEAPQICDGINNDCNDPNWPNLPSEELDDDGDSYSACEGDCDESNPLIHPGANEVCNGVDDNCNMLIDDDGLGEDSDGDSIHNACDNCPGTVNVSQVDTDGDGFGDACEYCVLVPDPDKTDSDSDSEIDLCDSDDGLIYIRFDAPTVVEWDLELGFDAWNVYRGDLEVLKNSGVYTQLPGSNSLAAQQCGLIALANFVQDTDEPGLGMVAFYLTTGIDSDGMESDLDADSSGTPRPNDNPCP